MIYLQLDDDFTEINEPAGIIQNLSPFTLEISTTGVPGSGTLLTSRQVYFFSNPPIYARCPDGTAKVRIVTSGFNACCCDNNLCSSCCGNSSGGSSGDDSDHSDCIKRILLDGREQLVSDNTATLNLSAYLKGHETVSRSEVRALFR